MHTSKLLLKIANKVKKAITPDFTRYILFFISALALQFAIWNYVQPREFIGYDPAFILIFTINLKLALNIILFSFLTALFLPIPLLRKNTKGQQIIFILLSTLIYPIIYFGILGLTGILGFFFILLLLLSLLYFLYILLKLRKNKIVRRLLILFIQYLIIYVFAQIVILTLWSFYYGLNQHIYYIKFLISSFAWLLITEIIVTVAIFLMYLNPFSIKRLLKSENFKFVFPSLKFLMVITILISFMSVLVGAQIPQKARGKYCYYIDLCYSCGNTYYKEWCLKTGQLYVTYDAELEGNYKAKFPLPNNIKVKRLIRPKGISTTGSIIIEDKNGHKYVVNAIRDDNGKPKFTIQRIK